MAFTGPPSSSHHRRLPFFHHKNHPGPIEGDLPQYDNPIHQQVPTSHPAPGVQESDSRRNSTISIDDNTPYAPGDIAGMLKRFKLKQEGNIITGKDRHIDKAVTHAIQDHDLALQQLLFADPSIVSRHMTFAGHTDCTLLHAAARYDDKDALYIVSKSITDVNVRSSDGFTPLHFASGYGHPNMVKLLLNHGADVKAMAQPDNKSTSGHFGEGYTPLHVAVHRGCVDTSHILLDGGAEVDARDKEGWTSLHFASRYGYAPLVKILVGYGADVNAADNHGRTAMHYAALSGDVETVKLLIGEGVDPNVKAKDGITPLELAIRDKNSKVVELLEGYGVEGSDQVKHKKHLLGNLGKPDEHEQGTKVNLMSF